MQYYGNYQQGNFIYWSIRGYFYEKIILNYRALLVGKQIEKQTEFSNIRCCKTVSAIGRSLSSSASTARRQPAVMLPSTAEEANDGKEV
jgi:hypothetical protein